MNIETVVAGRHMSPAKEIIESFASRTRKLLSLDGIKKKLCLVVPDLRTIKADKLDSADAILARIRTKPSSIEA